MAVLEGLSPTVRELLHCPHCASELILHNERTYECSNGDCNRSFPIVDGIPVLIDEDASIFSIADFLQKHDTYFSRSPLSLLIDSCKRRLPTISKNIKGRENYRRVAEQLLAFPAPQRVLVLGGSILGEGMAPLLDQASVELVETDISFGPRTMLICDAHSIPFADETFDAIIVQAVLEHVVDPYRCVSEIHRVMKTGGVVYAETPFIQQVHGGRYDFTRFTHLGHRRLFNRFDEVDSGAVCGPGMALAWSYEYFLLSFATRKVTRALIRVVADFSAFWLKYLDAYLIDKPGALDAASGYYFLGRKGGRTLSDRELLTLYRGAM